jgi:hypothetical protein
MTRTRQTQFAAKRLLCTRRAGSVLLALTMFASSLVARANDPTDGGGRFWSFDPPRRPSVPAVRASDRVRTPIDAFVLAKLEENGRTLSPDADRLTLFRRAALDLTGLPPSPADLEAFLGDTASGAYERLIDRLLDSPHYGERWGRHWLDVAGYSDSRGILVGEVPRPTHYLYRDYVIRAFNDDKPYDRFLQEQIAGDELVDFHDVARSVIDLPSEVVDAVVATGFLRNSADASRPDFTNIKHAPMYYFDTLNDAIAIVGSATLGLTLHCAKCHDHKYDPISQREFYQIQAIFKSGYRPEQWLAEENRFIEWASDAEKHRAAEHNKRVQAGIDRLRADAESLRKQYAEKIFSDRLSKLPEPIRDDVKQALATAPNARDDVQKYLVSKFQKELEAPREELAKLFPDFKTKADELNAAIRAEEAKKKTFVKIRALYDQAGEPKTHVMKRGDWRSPGEEVGPGVPAALAAPLHFDWSPPPPDATTSGRRLAFARWLTQPDHPLTARVMVNRIWLHHFGTGLVGTPDDFGAKGEPPSHPELLDWLATEFVDRGWSVKAMHRLIMTSSVYRQSSQISNPQSESIASNSLLSRFPLRRLEAEVIRDSVLAAAGSLNRRQFGPAVPLVARPDGEVVTPDGPDGWRRSVYLFVGRKVPVTMLSLFDQPMISVNCTRRGTSTLASQALDLLNSDFMIKHAELFAQRLLRESASSRHGEPTWNPTRAVRLAYQSCFGRGPSAAENLDAVQFVLDQSGRHIAASQTGNLADAQGRALADFCHLLLCANEFVYAD